jgi:hypothetical protein
MIRVIKTGGPAFWHLLEPGARLVYKIYVDKLAAGKISDPG